PTRAQELHETQARLVCNWPELDPFGARNDVEYLGPQADAQPNLRVEWRTEARPRVFAYLKPRDPRFIAVLDAISQVAGEAIVAAPGVGTREAALLSNGPIRMLDEPVDLSILQRTDLCVG